MQTKLKILTEVPLKKYSTFGIGGNSKLLTEVFSTQEISQALLYCQIQKIPYIVIGKGSNSLFDDLGFNGMVIINKINFLTSPEPGFFHVGAGYSFSLLGVKTAREGWSGLEFASGIPGSVGGAVFMNAGANGSETSTNLHSIDYINEQGTSQVIPAKDVEFGYRYSAFQKMKGAIVGATFKLSRCSEARKKQIEIVNYRSKTQPYHEKSIGCIFRNPQNSHAGRLIDSCRLKGYEIGGAKVSEIHANFIVNKGDAKAEDVLSLIRHIQSVIKQEEGIELEIEARYIPSPRNLHD